MVEESFSGFCKRTATMPRDDRRILEQRFEHSRISLENRGKVRVLSTICLCDVCRRAHDHGKRVICWPPHISGGHISHKMCSTTFCALAAPARVCAGGSGLTAVPTATCAQHFRGADPLRALSA